MTRRVRTILAAGAAEDVRLGPNDAEGVPRARTRGHGALLQRRWLPRARLQDGSNVIAGRGYEGWTRASVAGTFNASIKEKIRARQPSENNVARANRAGNPGPIAPGGQHSMPAKSREDVFAFLGSPGTRSTNVLTNRRKTDHGRVTLLRLRDRRPTRLSARAAIYICGDWFAKAATGPLLASRLPRARVQNVDWKTSRTPLLDQFTPANRGHRPTRVFEFSDRFASRVRFRRLTATARSPPSPVRSSLTLNQLI